MPRNILSGKKFVHLHQKKEKRGIASKGFSISGLKVRSELHLSNKVYTSCFSDKQRKMLCYIVFFFGVFIPVSAALSAVPEAHSFFYLTSDSVTDSPKFTDEEFYSKSTSVIFKVNSVEISPNDKFFDIYRNEILPAVNQRHLQLRKIFIRGAASPEGPYANNQRLARGRSAALLNLLKRDLRFQYLEAEVDMSSVTEDYGYLCVLMKKANDRDYSVVKEIYDSCNGDELTCKKRLMSFSNGTLWKRLLKEYFPQLRAARLILWFAEPDEAHAPEPLFKVTEDIVIKNTTVEHIDLDTLTRWVPELIIETPQYTRRHLIAARTNLVHDFFYMPNFGMAFSPNLQLEYYPLRGHLTYNIGVTWGTMRKWNSHQFWQVRDVQFELRRYFKGGGRFIGPYLGVVLHGDVYGIGLSDTKGWQGEGGGADISAGYTMRLNKKGSLRLEFMLSAGFFYTVFDPYVWGNPVTGTADGDYYYDYLGNGSNFKKRNHRFTWFGPTNLGIQLTYDIIYRKKQRVR